MVVRGDMQYMEIHEMITGNSFYKPSDPKWTWEMFWNKLQETKIYVCRDLEYDIFFRKHPENNNCVMIVVICGNTIKYDGTNNPIFGIISEAEKKFHENHDNPITDIYIVDINPHIRGDHVEYPPCWHLVNTFEDNTLSFFFPLEIITPFLSGKINVLNYFKVKDGVDPFAFSDHILSIYLDTIRNLQNYNEILGKEVKSDAGKSSEPCGE